MPVALVSLVESDRQRFAAYAGTTLSETPIASSVCAIAIQDRSVLVIPDLSADPRTCDMPIVRDDPRLRFYAGAPLVTSRGIAIGSLCAIDLVPRPEGLASEHVLALQALARQVVSQMEADAERRSANQRPGSEVLGTWDWDVAANRVTSDSYFAALYRVDPVDARNGAPIQKFFHAIHPADLPTVHEQIDQALKTGEPFYAEYRLIQADGSTRWVAAQGRCLLAEDGSPKRFPGLSFDIDERKRSEARLAALVELSDCLRDDGSPSDLAYAAASLLGRTLEVSRAGYGSIDPMSETLSIERDWTGEGIESLAGVFRFSDYGSYFDDLMRGEIVIVADAEADPRTRATAVALKGIKAQAVINVPVRERGGTVALLYLTNGAPRRWSPGEIEFVREVAQRTRDAVERRRAENDLAALTASLEQQVQERTRELVDAEESLRQAQKMEAVGQLTGGLAHDFNNMLTGIIGALEMMKFRIGQGKVGELERYVHMAEGAATRAAALTHRLLAFSRRQTLAPRPTAMGRLVADMEELICRTVGPSISLDVQGAADLWLTMVDPNQLENALLNLCINARDAMPAGGLITIRMSNHLLGPREARQGDLASGEYVLLSVTDTGSGMTDEVKARAFDPFYTTKPLGEGTGLGLSMIYGFARQSGGQVRIDSEVGVGTTMSILLSRYQGADGDEGDADSKRPMLRADRGATVLLVDDEPTIRMLVSELLSDLGHMPLEAADGASALRLLQSETPIDLLITDVGLPGMLNGRQVADAARLHRPDLKILFVTGYAESVVLSHDRLEPGMRVVTKPFQMDTLTETIAEMLRDR